MNLLGTETPLWAYLAAVAFVAVACWAWNWFRDQYEPAWTSRLPRFTRRWYGTGAHVCLKVAAEGLDVPDRYEVLEWGDRFTPVPWLCVRNMEDEDAVALWGPVTDFSALYVRKWHPFLALRLLLTGHPMSPRSHDSLPLGHGAPRERRPS